MNNIELIKVFDQAIKFNEDVLVEYCLPDYKDTLIEVVLNANINKMKLKFYDKQIVNAFAFVLQRRMQN